ncbi:MAG: glycosyltransferase 87 family protein [Actinomycetota bacterium]
MAADRRRITLFLLGFAVVGLTAGFLLKQPCASGAWDGDPARTDDNGKQYRQLCYSDIVPLYGARGLAEGHFPYVDGNLEYPAGTGLYVGVIAQLTSTLVSYVYANSIGLALMGLVAAAALAFMARDPRRVLLFALGPPLILYAFHNWDLLAVGLATLGLYAFWRGADGWAGLLLGVGAATKLYPAFLLPAIALAAWKRDARPPWRMAGTFVLGAALLNVPLMIANFDGWKYPWDFQGKRSANFETSWFMIFRHTGGSWFTDGGLVNAISGGAFVVGAGLLLIAESLRERVRPYALAFGILIVFLLTAKVFSPQYALWLLPFFALLRLPIWSYLAFVVTDAAVWVSVSAYFLAIQYGSGDAAWRLTVLEYAVWARYGVLIALLYLSHRAEELVAEAPGQAHQPAPVPLTA